MNISEANVKQAVELLKVLISTPSISREESDATDKLQLFIERGAPVRCEVHRHLNNLWCVAPGFDASRPTLLLDAHIDTVKPVSGWSKHPFTPSCHFGCYTYHLVVFILSFKQCGYFLHSFCPFL